MVGAPWLSPTPTNSDRVLFSRQSVSFAFYGRLGNQHHAVIALRCIYAKVQSLGGYESPVVRESKHKFYVERKPVPLSIQSPACVPGMGHWTADLLIWIRG